MGEANESRMKAAVSGIGIVSDAIGVCVLIADVVLMKILFSS